MSCGKMLEYVTRYVFHNSTKCSVLSFAYKFPIKLDDFPVAVDESNLGSAVQTASHTKLLNLETVPLTSRLSDKLLKPLLKHHLPEPTPPRQHDKN